MAAFESLNWTELDCRAIIAERGVLTLKSSDRMISRQWLKLHQYETICLDFSKGISNVVIQLNTILDWKSQFGYELSPDSRKLDSLRDGLNFNVREDGGTALELINFENAYLENSEWSLGLLALVSEYSLQQLALGKRFFTVVEVTTDSSTLIGQKFEALIINYPSRLGPRLNTSIL